MGIVIYVLARNFFVMGRLLSFLSVFFIAQVNCRNTPCYTENEARIESCHPYLASESYSKNILSPKCDVDQTTILAISGSIEYTQACVADELSISLPTENEFREEVFCGDFSTKFEISNEGNVSISFRSDENVQQGGFVIEIRNCLRYQSIFFRYLNIQIVLLLRKTYFHLI